MIFVRLPESRNLSVAGNNQNPRDSSLSLAAYSTYICIWALGEYLAGHRRELLGLVRCPLKAASCPDFSTEGPYVREEVGRYLDGGVVIISTNPCNSNIIGCIHMRMEKDTFPKYSG